MDSSCCSQYVVLFCNSVLEIVSRVFQLGMLVASKVLAQLACRNEVLVFVKVSFCANGDKRKGCFCFLEITVLTSCRCTLVK